MTDFVREKEKRLEELKVEDEVKSEELSIAQKKALIAEAKQKYGKDWKKIIFGAVKGLKVNEESLQTMYNCNLGGLRDLSRTHTKRM